MKTTFFEFVSYKFEPSKKLVSFNYKIEFSDADSLTFTEKIVLPGKAEHIPDEIIDNILQALHIILGISYYKLYCPPRIRLNKPLTKDQAEFFSTVYRKGLGEFCYRNKIDPKKIAKFPHEKIAVKNCRFPRRDRAIVGIGGGKDSIVAVEMLKDMKYPIDAILLETQKGADVTDNVVKMTGLNHLRITRFLDEKIFLPHVGSYNGHVPISAVFAFLGTLACALYDYSYFVVANEHSSNFGNISYKGEVVNHQWSKSAEFEQMAQDYIRKFITPDITYFSAIRPFYEIRVVEMFLKYPKYFSTFSSCNRNFKAHKERTKKLWCCECPKCAFLFAMMAAFLSRNEIVKIFGKNLFQDPALLPMFRDILGFGKLKPFDCVGTFDESRAAFWMARENFKNDLAIKTFLPKIKDGEELVKKVFRTTPSPTVPSKFQFFGMKKALILGYAREGKVTHEYLKKFYPNLEVGIADAQDGKDYLKKQFEFDIAIKTPGINKSQIKIPYTTATNIFFSQVQNNLTIGITGSKGKSTTTSLIYSILKEAGKKVHLLGNIGYPMLESLLGNVDRDDVFVLELSSYQLDDIKFSPNIAVATNLFPEHMDFHGGVNEYYGAKKNIVAHQRDGDFFVYNSGVKDFKKWETPAKKIPSDKKLAFNGWDIPLLGEHNRSNLQLAYAVAKILKISDSTIKRAVAKFKPLEHRLEFVGDFKGIRFYNDALSTAPESTIMAIKSVPNIGTIFLGGEDRGYDFSELRKVLKKYRIKNIVLFPDSGKRILESRTGFNVLETRSMKEAVAFGYKYTKKGQACLLSTASPSYGVWKNYEEKGGEFKREVIGHRS